MRRSLPLSLLTFALLASGALAADSSLWLHVRVDEGGDDAKVTVNLPLSLIGKALPMLDVGDHLDRHSIRFDDHHLSYDELREIWLEVREGPDMAFVTVEQDDESVRVWKEKGTLFVNVRGRRNEQVDVRMPLSVVDAFLRADQGFDLDAAIGALVEHGPGELVRVDDEGESVRVWIDTTPEATD